MQNPEENTTKQKGDNVILSVSSGPSQLDMPDLRGMNLEDAMTKVKSMGLVLTIQKIINGDYEVNTVISQEPAVNEKVSKDTTVTLTVSGGKVSVPKLAYTTLADAEELLKQTGLRMGSTLNIVDTRNAKEHGKVSSQSPAENTDAMLDDIVSVNVFRYLSDSSSKEITVQLKEENKDINVRVMLRAEGSDVEYEVYQHLYPADLERQQTIMLNLPDERTYTCTVYQDDEPQEPFVIDR